jgi:hypothetical protein
VRRHAGLIVGLASLLLAACGGSSSASSSVPATTGSSGGSPATTGSVSSGAASAASTTPPTATRSSSSATPTSSSSSATPTSSTSSASESRSSSTARSVARAGNSDVRIPVTFAIGAGGSLAPPQIAVPKQIALALSVASKDGRSHTFQLRTPHRYLATVRPGTPIRALLKGTPPGSYAIAVDGRVTGSLIVGVAPGP